MLHLKYVPRETRLADYITVNHFITTHEMLMTFRITKFAASFASTSASVTTTSTVAEMFVSTKRSLRSCFSETYYSHWNILSC